MNSTHPLRSPATGTSVRPGGIALELRGVTRSFVSARGGAVPVLAPLDLEIRSGEFVAVLGPSGCGKSTLLRIVAQLDRPSAGQVLFAGGGAGAAAEERPQRIAYVFQDAHLLPWRTVLRNVSLPLELAGQARGESVAEARDAVERVGLGDALDRYPGELSGGMRMRVSLARALVTRPQLLLLDEPFAALDEITREELDLELRALWAATGVTVLFVTHAVAEATFLAERALVLSRRPARVLLDHRIDLPEPRHALLRGEARFAEQAGALHRALLAGARP